MTGERPQQPGTRLFTGPTIYQAIPAKEAEFCGAVRSHEFLSLAQASLGRMRSSRPEEMDYYYLDMPQDHSVLLFTSFLGLCSFFLAIFGS